MCVPGIFQRPGPIPRAVLLSFSLVVVSWELNGNRNARKVLTQLPQIYSFTLPHSPLADRTRTQRLTFPTSHVKARAFLRASSVDSYLVLILPSLFPPQAPGGTASSLRGTHQHRTLNSFSKLRGRSLLPPCYKLRPREGK